MDPVIGAKMFLLPAEFDAYQSRCSSRQFMAPSLESIAFRISPTSILDSGSISRRNKRPTGRAPAMAQGINRGVGFQW
jgi:hypothetical protein